MFYFILMASLAIFHDDTRPTPSDKLFQEWSTCLAPVPIEGSLKEFLFFFDPRSDKAFIKFTDERLDMTIVRDSITGFSSAVWMNWMLQPTVNPLVDRDAKPSAYSLPPERNRLSLLRFEGKIGEQSASFTESVNGLIIEIPLSNEQKNNGIRKQELFLLLKKMVSDKYLMKEGSQDIDQGDKLCKSGYVLSSIDVGDSLSQFQKKESWPVLALLTNRSIIVFLLKPPPAALNDMMAFAGRFDEKEWLPRYLTDQKGKLLVEKLFGPEYLQLKRGLK